MFIMGSGKRILNADDSKTMTNITFRILKDANYADVDVVYDGGSALAALRRKKYDLVITDSQMQPISGLELIKLIRADSSYRRFESSFSPDYMTRTMTYGSKGQTGMSKSHLSQEISRKKWKTSCLRMLCWHEETDFPTNSVRRLVSTMSALPPKADMCGALAHVCLGP